MPFLTRTKEIVVLTVEEEEGRPDDADRLARSLAWHGLAATVERLTPGAHGAAETLLAAVSTKAGLLVMGGYGHSRIGEWVFGGFTQRVLADAPLPVLIAHQTGIEITAPRDRPTSRVPPASAANTKSSYARSARWASRARRPGAYLVAKVACTNPC
jgi:hypothetical protein